MRCLVIQCVFLNVTQLSHSPSHSCSILFTADSIYLNLCQIPLLPTSEQDCLRHHVLPHLRSSIDFGAAVHPRALTCLLRAGTCLYGSGGGLGSSLDDMGSLGSAKHGGGGGAEEKANAEEFVSQIVPSLIKLFGSNERSVRVSLLQVLSMMIP